MIRLLVDENISGNIMRAILRQNPNADIIRVQDTEVFEKSEPEVLEWAAKEGRILLTHDVQTIPKYAGERLISGQSMPSIIVARQELPIGQVIEELSLTCS